MSVKFGFLLLLLFSSQAAHGAHCDENNWNRLLKKQLTIEKWLENYSLEFNQVLETYRKQVVFSTQFTEQDLMFLFSHDQPTINDKFEQHKQSSYHAYERLLNHSYIIAIEGEDTQSLAASWNKIAQHCMNQARPINSQTANEHALSSISLTKDIQELSNKFRKIAYSYKAEAAIIEKVRQQTQEN